MIFNFYFKTKEEAKELFNILNIESKKHFNENYRIYPLLKNLEETQVGYTIDIPNHLYFEDIEKSKQYIREQNKTNQWHNIKENSDDLPELPYQMVIVKTGYYFKDNQQYLKIDWLTENNKWYKFEGKVMEWTHINTDEILFNDFYEDVMDSLSFVPRVEVY